MNQKNNIEEFISFLQVLDQHEVLPHVILVGSWAEYLYMETNLIPDFSTTVRTMDADFLIMNAKQPRNPINLTEIARSLGYTIEYDYMFGTSKIYTPKLFEIEFLIPQLGDGTRDVIETNLGVNAQPLTHLTVLKDYAVAVEFNGMTINVPIPEAYILQKMIVNGRRKEKTDKDTKSILNILPHVQFDIFNNILSTLSKKEKRLVDVFVGDHDLQWVYEPQADEIDKRKHNGLCH